MIQTTGAIMLSIERAQLITVQDVGAPTGSLDGSLLNVLSVQPHFLSNSHQPQVLQPSSKGAVNV